MARNKRTGDRGTELVGAFRGSGQTRKAYCASLGIALTTLDYYLRRERLRERQKARLMPVEVLPAQTEREGRRSGVTVALPGGLRVELEAGFDPGTLRRLLEALA